MFRRMCTYICVVLKLPTPFPQIYSLFCLFSTFCAVIQTFECVCLLYIYKHLFTQLRSYYVKFKNDIMLKVEVTQTWFTEAHISEQFHNIVQATGDR